MKVYLIGAGPGDPGLFTLKGKDVLSRADVVVYDYLANEALLEYAPASAERIYAGKKGGDHTLSQDAINALIIAKAKEGKLVVRLKGGDPYMFGRGGEEAEELLAAGVPFEEVPGISSAIGGPAYAGIPLTHRSSASSVCFATGHEDPEKEESAHNWAALAQGGHTLVFFMGMKNLPVIVSNLLRHGMAADTPAALVQWGTTSRHRSLVSNLAQLPEEGAKQGFSSPSLIIIGEVVRLHDRLNWFERQPLYGKTIVVTRAREQASESVALLQSFGAEVIQFPTIEIVPMPDYKALHEALYAISQYQWLIFTSVNSVEFFWRELESLDLDSRALHAVCIAAIGPATVEAIRKRGIQPDLVPEQFVAESLAAAFAEKNMQGKKVLLPRALDAREVLPDALRSTGALVDIIPVYQNVPSSAKKEDVEKLLAQEHIDCITFGSSSAVDHFFRFISPEVLKAKKLPRLACIGPITAATLARYGFDSPIQATEYTIPSLVDALVREL